MDEIRTCIRCEEEKPLDKEHFYFRETRNNFETACKKCRNARTMANRKVDPERTKEWKRNWYRENAYRQLQANRRRREAMTDEERKEARKVAKAKHADYRQRKIQAYLDAHDGLSPLCACGCGERVKFNSQGKPRTYAGQNHYLNVMDMPKRISEAHAQKADEENRIPIEVFRKAVLKVKEDKGWSWRQVAEAGGWSYNHVKAIMFDKRAKNVGRQIGEDFFARIAGRPAPPSTYMQKKAQEEHIRLTHRHAVLNRMYMQDAS